MLSILSLSNLTIEYKLKVVSHSWKSESRVNVNLKLPVKGNEIRVTQNLRVTIWESSHELQARNLSREGIFILGIYKAWALAATVKKVSSQKYTRKHLCWGLFVIRVACYE